MKFLLGGGHVSVTHKTSRSWELKKSRRIKVFLTSDLVFTRQELELWLRKAERPGAAISGFRDILVQV